MYLNDAKIKAANPSEKAYKMADGDGLVLLIQPNGSKWWRYRYRCMRCTAWAITAGTLGMVSVG